MLFLPFSHCSNCSPVFLRKSNVHLQEKRQNPLIWNTKAGLRKEKLGKLLTLVEANFCAENHPRAGLPCVVVCRHTHTHRLPLQGGTCNHNCPLCAPAPKLSQNSLAKTSCRSSKHPEWQQAESMKRWAQGMGLAEICPWLLPGARAMLPLQGEFSVCLKVGSH